MLNSVSVMGPAKRGESRINFRNYKKALCDCLETHVSREDRVTMIGSRWGVPAIHAARKGAFVTVYDASQKSIKQIRHTTRQNRPTGTVDVIHRTVGNPVSLRTQAPVVTPSKLKECSVLVVNCGGSECDILPSLDNYSSVKTVIVECHKTTDSPIETVSNILNNKNFRVLREYPPSKFADNNAGLLLASNQDSSY